jgi:F-type H+-transporting ATPase subunit a
MWPFLAEGDKNATQVDRAFHHALVHHLGGHPILTNALVMMGIAAALILFITVAIDRRSFVPRGVFRNAMESIALFIRNMTRDAHLPDKFVPLFATFFLFILTMNLLGMIPIPVIAHTPTSTMWVAVALASCVLLVSTLSGFVYHGVGGFAKLFVPGGLPSVLVPPLFVLEFVGYFIKHSVLAVRLFANMIAGHLVIGAFLGLIGDMGSYGMAALSVPLSLFVSCLELLVAFLQAYVFTLLAVLFVGGMVHPDH